LKTSDFAAVWPGYPVICVDSKSYTGEQNITTVTRLKTRGVCEHYTDTVLVSGIGDGESQTGGAESHR
jgi:hypothetical protein